MPKIAIDAPFPGTGSEGGSEHVILGLLTGLGKLKDGNEEYVIVTPHESTDWLTPYIGPNQMIIREPARELTARERIKKILGPLKKPAGDMLRAAKLLPRHNPYAVAPTPHSSGFIESLGIDLFHATYPLHFYLSKIPTLLTVHDLQHRHFPEFFKENDLPWREQLFPEALAHATQVSTISWFVGNDVRKCYQTPAEKMNVIPWASPTQCYPRVESAPAESVLRKFKLNGPFILYPSVTYGHKNHIRLLEAIALLKAQEGIEVTLVCTGWKKLHWPKIQERLTELKLENQVKFVGYVSSREMKALYLLSRFVVFPSLFEGCGLALLEAFEERKAVAASDIPPFREYGLNAPEYFDPKDVRSMARALMNLWMDHTARDEKEKLGATISRTYQWEKVARHYRAIYRSMLGIELSAVEEKLIADGKMSGQPANTSDLPRSPEISE